MGLGEKEWVTRFRIKEGENVFFLEIGKIGVGGNAKLKIFFVRPYLLPRTAELLKPPYVHIPHIS